MNRKGQAAMEFLMTYGWAILAAIIAIGVLAYFGIFSPGRFVQDSVTVNAPFNAKGIVATSGSPGSIQLELLNGVGETVNLTSIAITNCNSAGETFGTNQPTANSTVYTVTCSGALTAGETFRGDITVSYRKSDSALTLQSTGSATTKVR